MICILLPVENLQYTLLVETKILIPRNAKTQTFLNDDNSVYFLNMFNYIAFLYCYSIHIFQFAAFNNVLKIFNVTMWR